MVAQACAAKINPQISVRWMDCKGQGQHETAYKSGIQFPQVERQRLQGMSRTMANMPAPAPAAHAPEMSSRTKPPSVHVFVVSSMHCATSSASYPSEHRQQLPHLQQPKVNPNPNQQVQEANHNITITWARDFGLKRQVQQIRALLESNQRREGALPNYMSIRNSTTATSAGVEFLFGHTEVEIRSKVRTLLEFGSFEEPETFSEAPPRNRAQEHISPGIFLCQPSVTAFLKC